MIDLSPDGERREEPRVVTSWVTKCFNRACPESSNSNDERPKKWVILDVIAPYSPQGRFQINACSWVCVASGILSRLEPGPHWRMPAYLGAEDNGTLSLWAGALSGFTLHTETRDGGDVIALRHRCGDVEDMPDGVYAGDIVNLVIAHRDGKCQQPLRCPNCRATLPQCNLSGCGQRRAPGWRNADHNCLNDKGACTHGPECEICTTPRLPAEGAPSGQYRCICPRCKRDCDPLRLDQRPEAQDDIAYLRGDDEPTV